VEKEKREKISVMGSEELPRELRQVGHQDYPR
jgi:hypothetical protein